MRRKHLLAAALVLGVTVGGGAVVIAQADTGDACDAARSDREYMQCRFDRIDKHLAELAADRPTTEPTPTTSPTPSSTPTPTPSVTPTVTPTLPPPVTPTPTPTAAQSAGWPDATNTGVPAGTKLTAYTGPCTITAAGTVIDAKVIACALNIKAAGVKISRSQIIGNISSGTDKTKNYSFDLADSEISAPAGVTAVGEVNFTVTRSNIHGGNRGGHCWLNCVVTDSWIHGTIVTGQEHASGFRASENTVLRHNTIACDARDVPPDGGCSAAVTGYGDFGPVRNNVIDGNLIKAGSGGYCMYGGSTKGKPYPNATGQVFTNNVFERGQSKSDHGTYICGYYGPITGFDTTQPGNVWSNNTYDDGTTVAPAN